MSNKKIKWEFIYQEREVSLSPFYLFAKPWGMVIKDIFGKNLEPLIMIYTKKGVEYYVPEKDFTAIGRRTYNLFLKDRFYKKMTAKVDFYAKKLTSIAEQVESKNLLKMSEEQLIYYIKKLHGLMLHLNKWGQLLSLTEYGYNNFTTKGLIKKIEDKVKKIKISVSPMQISRILSQPVRSTFFRSERLNLFKIASEIKKRNLKLTSPIVKTWIKNHQRRFCWINFGYIGPALEINYFTNDFRDLLKKNNVVELYKEKKIELKKIIKEQTGLEDKLKLNRFIEKRYYIVRDQTFYKEYRKEILFHGFYACELVQKELAKRWHFPQIYFRYILPHEYIKSNIALLYNQRKGLCVYYIERGKEFVFTGREANDKIAMVKKVGQRVEKVKELRGNIAFIGKAVGSAKIVMGVDHLKKVKKGDILVSFSTNPQMVPVMKIVGAIVTEQGGITSHAAIISRELHIPCLVGVKDATRVLKDGDVVEVDAFKGIVRKLK